jgi:RNase P subunit RPR2
MSQVAPPMNDDQSPLTTLISCVDCAKTMRIEKIDPDGKGRDMIQYRCDHCGRIERLRLIRRTWPSARQTRR